MTHPDQLVLPCTHLGELLRRLREEGGRSEAPAAASRDRSGAMSIEGVVGGLVALGGRIDAATYRDIEDGRLSPRDLDRFLAAFVACLRLDEHARRALWVQAAFDVLRVDLGEELARVALAEAFEDARATAGA